jgi:hypothetical protein
MYDAFDHAIVDGNKWKRDKNACIYIPSFLLLSGLKYQIIHTRTRIVFWFEAGDDYIEVLSFHIRGKQVYFPSRLDVNPVLF